MEIETDDTEIQQMWTKIKKTETGYDFSYFQYIEIDHELPSCETYSDEDIVKSIMDSKKTILEDDNDDDNPILPPVDAKSAIDSVKKLIYFFQTSKNDCKEHLKNLMKMEQDITSQAFQNMSQDKIETSPTSGLLFCLLLNPVCY